MSNRSSFQNYNTSGVHALEADADGLGIFSKILLERIIVNGGTNGTLTINQSDESGGTSVIEDVRVALVTVPASFTPFSIEFGCIIEDTLIITASAATDITVIFKRLP